MSRHVKSKQTVVTSAVKLTLDSVREELKKVVGYTVTHGKSILLAGRKDEMEKKGLKYER